MKSEEYEKKCMSEMEGLNKWGRPLGRWKDRIKECMSERGTGRGEGLEQRGSVWLVRNGGSSAMAISLGELYEGVRVYKETARLV